MRRTTVTTVTTVILFAILATSTQAQLPVARQPDKLPDPTTPNVPLPDRQGGDTIASAHVIENLPYATTGTTTGYNNNYDEVCPYSGSTAPDVVYAHTPADDIVIEIDLCGSSYDTKVYVYDAALNLIACNDDFYFGDPCGTYVSYLGGIALAGGQRYYIIIDGYGTAHGEYVLEIAGHQPPYPCLVIPSCAAALEDEPPLVDGYVDQYNGGCNSVEHGAPFTDLPMFDGYHNFDEFAGTLGWFQGPDGGNHRDTDWLRGIFPVDWADLEIEAAQPVIVFWIEPADCDYLVVQESLFLDACERGTMHLTGTAHEEFWLVIVPQTFTPPADFPGGEFGYRINLGGMLQGSCLSLGPDSDYTFDSQRLLASHHATSFLSYECHDDVNLSHLCGSGPQTPGGDAMATVYLEAGQTINILWFPIYFLAHLEEPRFFSGCLALFSDFRPQFRTCVDAVCVLDGFNAFRSLTAQETGWHWLVFDDPDREGSDQWGELWFDPILPPPAPAHDTCAGAVLIPPGNFVFMDDLTTATNQVDPGRDGCPDASDASYTSRDVVYRVAIPAGHTLDATLLPQGAWDAALYLVSDCESPIGACITAGRLEDGAMKLRYTAAADEDLWLVCDSFGLGERPFVLYGSLAQVTDAPPAPPSALAVQAYPNPFNPATRFSFTLPHAGEARLQVFTLDGRLLRTLVHADRPAGRHDAHWDGRDAAGRTVASGAYVVRLEAGGQATTERVLLLK